MAAEMIRSKALLGLIDLGTNGEIVIGSRERLLCASTAAGPAFEGANISSGMRAAAGAISAVEARGGRLRCHVIGDGPPRGVCGSGLVDAIAAGLDLGTILPTGRLDHGADRMPLCPPVSISQADVRQMQLAKGAIAAGVQILLERLGAKADDLERVYIAGAFGNYVNLRSANRIGMLPFPIGKAFPAGNTALQGAKIALFADPSKPDPWNGILERMEHVPLSADPRFQEIYVEQMLFPELAPESRAAGPGG